MKEHYFHFSGSRAPAKVLLTLFFLLACAYFSAVYGQNTITGTITSEGDGIPLPGVSVVDVNQPSNGVIADFDGNYSITVDDSNTSLRFISMGYQTIEVPVNGQSSLNIQMSEDVAKLEEVVVVGYGTQKKVTVTGAVTAVKGEELTESPAVNLSNSLAGRLPGVVAIQTSGEPGFDGSNINIRGINTLGNNSPLVIIDGVPDRDGGLSRLNPNDVASMSVLKDASAAIYGARAANGAILITTKKGNTGKPSITYDYSYGWQQPTQIPEMSNAVEYATIMNEIPIYNNIPVSEWGAAWDGISNSSSYTSPTAGVGTLNANYSPDAIAAHGNGSDPWLYPNEDWFDATFKNWSPQQRHNLQMTGGNDKIRYFSSLGYLDQDAYYKNSATRYQQYDMRLNLEAQVSDYIKTDIGALLRREDRNFPTQSAGAIFRMLMRGRPTEPAVWPNGLPGPDIENGQNPVVVTTNDTGYDRTPTDYVQINGSIEITNPWVDGLKVTLSGAVDHSAARQKKWETPWTLYYLDRDEYIATGNPVLNGAIRSTFNDARLTQSSSNTLNTNMTALVNYDRIINDDHTINLMAGVTRETFTGDNFYAFRRNYISTAVDQLFAGGSEQQDTGGSGYERARLGYYGRAQYNYKEKYLAEFIWRYDGSYIFPEVSRFGFFPGFLAGWNISNEDFFKVDFVDYLKLRASYGQMGNDQVFFNDQLQEYAFLSTYGFGQYPINSAVQTTLREVLSANPDFTWERANNLNIGLDGTLLDGHLDFTLEYFYNKRDNILIQQTGSTPASSGIADYLPPVNAGKVDNSGFEFHFNYRDITKSDFSYSVGVNGGYAQNKIVYMDEIPGAPNYQLQEGKPIGSFLVYEYDGVFADQASINANTLDYSAVTPTLKPGDMKFKDVNGDGIIDGDDQVRLDKSATPTFNYGATMNFSYKNFDLDILFQGATGAAIRIQTESGDIGNFLKHSFDNRWSIDNPSSVHPRLASRGDTYYTGGSYGNNTYYLFDKNYLRLKNVQLGYNLPGDLTSKFGISSARLYVNAINLLTFNKYKIFDPEASAGSGVYYPQARVINTGIRLTF